jgi:hypothetical protein
MSQGLGWLCLAVVAAEITCIIVEALYGDESTCNWSKYCTTTSGNNVNWQRVWFVVLFLFTIVVMGILPALCGLFAKRMKSPFLQRVWDIRVKWLTYQPSTELFWRLSHLIFYFILGLTAPCYWKESLTLSVIWEWIECSGVGISLLQRLWKLPSTVDRGDLQLPTHSVICGGFEDITLNVLGLGLGLAIATAWV